MLASSHDVLCAGIMSLMIWFAFIFRVQPGRHHICRRLVPAAVGTMSAAVMLLSSSPLSLW
jgi:hypothetical protein